MRYNLTLGSVFYLGVGFLVNKVSEKDASMDIC